MAAPDIILNPQQVLLSETVSGLGIQTDSFGLLFGVIRAVYATSNRFVGGENVLFDPDNSIKLSYDGDDYFVVQEVSVFFTEVIPP